MLYTILLWSQETLHHMLRTKGSAKRREAHVLLQSKKLSREWCGCHVMSVMSYLDIPWFADPRSKMLHATFRSTLSHARTERATPPYRDLHARLHVHMSQSLPTYLTQPQYSNIPTYTGLPIPTVNSFPEILSRPALLRLQ